MDNTWTNLEESSIDEAIDRAIDSYFKKKVVADFDESGVEESIDAAIEQYFQKGMVADGLFWSKAVGILRGKIRQAEGGRMKAWSNG